MGPSLVMPAVPVQVGELTLLMETSVVSLVGTEPTSAAGRAADWALQSFDRVQSAIEQIAVSTAETIERAATRAARPTSVAIEFGIKVSAKGDVIIAGGSGEASLKVTLTYLSADSDIATADTADDTNP
ncbi:hypothetical protein KBX08_32970 [Micromonospora sp. H61]|uniref:CU044_2847 family protein n=1 Tax=Micromonospora sp. H61 TaxID=2824888 RepID=UPI001B38FA91|nr:CU044_2847 family protein [Micromonospora sp. H61]MBQ0994867.1 hypothetical protein [Micromonospora sp. H61]